MASYELSTWRTSTTSAANGNCVEVAPAPGGWLVRDSKHPGPRLAFRGAAWSALLSRAGRPPGPAR